MTEPPITIIEIATQRYNAFETLQHATLYFKSGVKSVWFIDPLLNVVALMLPNQKSKVFIEGDVKDDATGIPVRFDEIFEA